LKQPFERKGHAPEGTYLRSLWTEPSFGLALGSCVFSLAVIIGFPTDDRRLISRVVSCTNSNNADDGSPGKEKARERSEQELGASVASIGGRAQWVKRAAQAASAKRVCGAVAVGGDRQ